MRFYAVAQLVRASRFEREGCTFDSCLRNGGEKMTYEELAQKIDEHKEPTVELLKRYCKMNEVLPYEYYRQLLSVHPAFHPLPIEKPQYVNA